MDPDACLDRLLDSAAEPDETVQAASDLLCWLLGGGALPRRLVEECSPAEQDRIATLLARCADQLENAGGA